MKKIFFSITAVSLILFVSSCKQGNNGAEKKDAVTADSAKNDVWAELVESKTVMVKPEGFEEDYWNSVNKNVNHQKIFNTIVSAVISGKKKAYNIYNDSLLTVDEVKNVLDKEGPVSAGKTETKKMEANDISTIRMREKWVFDAEKFKLEKQVTRIDLLYKKLDENGDYLGDKALFYVNLNN